MTRQLTITAAEWASVHDGTLWLVRDRRIIPHPWVDGSTLPRPPAEFVQACAFCTACDARLWDRGHNRKTDCLDCRIELVGPCHCQLDAWHAHYCFNGTVTLGYAYAVGQPLPIIDGTITHATYPPDCLFTTGKGELVHDSKFTDETITDRLSHYGPPESLVGKWALQLAVTA